MRVSGMGGAGGGPKRLVVLCLLAAVLAGCGPGPLRWTHEPLAVAPGPGALLGRIDLEATARRAEMRFSYTRGEPAVTTHSLASEPDRPGGPYWRLTIELPAEVEPGNVTASSHVLSSELIGLSPGVRGWAYTAEFEHPLVADLRLKQNPDHTATLVLRLRQAVKVDLARDQAGVRVVMTRK